MTRALQSLSILLFAAAISACSSVPKQGSANNASQVFNAPIAQVKPAARAALQANGFSITKEEATYLEGFRDRKVGLLVGSGGETAGVWMTAQGNKTKVEVNTAKSFVGMAGQKNWDDEILVEIADELNQ